MVRLKSKVGIEAKNDSWDPVGASHYLQGKRMLVRHSCGGEVFEVPTYRNTLKESNCNNNIS